MNDENPTRLKRLYRLPVLGAVIYLLFPPRAAKRPVWKRSLSYAAGALAILGLAMAGYPYIGASYPGFLRAPVEQAIAWSNVFSDLQTNGIQKKLDVRFRQTAITETTNFAEGDPLTRLEIPRLRVDTIVVEGISATALKAGAGHYPGSKLPGEVGNVAIAGHRTTFGRPFENLDKMAPGDKVILETPRGRFTYVLEKRPYLTEPNDWSQIDFSPSEPVLTLTTCHPKGSAKERLVVRARLVSSEPVS